MNPGPPAAILLFLAILTLGFLHSPFSPDLGLSTCYYGDYNGVHAAIAQNPSLQILDTGLHRDMRLEDFWIRIAAEGTRIFELHVMDGSRVRDRNDPADGALIRLRDHRAAYYLPFTHPFWSFLQGRKVECIEDLLAEAEPFLDALDSANLSPERFDHLRAQSYIIIKYQPNLPN